MRRDIGVGDNMWIVGDETVVVYDKMVAMYDETAAIPKAMEAVCDKTVDVRNCVGYIS
jgi:hypothetical protein